MICLHLKGSKDGSHSQSPQVFSPVCKNYTSNHRRQISQCHHLPIMTCSNDNEEICAECPYHRAQRRQGLTEVESPEQDIESEHVCKEIPHIVRQPQMICIRHCVQCVHTLIRRCALIGRHTAECGVSPSAYLPGLLIVFGCIPSESHSCRRVVAIEYSALGVGWEEISKRQYYEQHHCQQIRQAFLECTHFLFYVFYFRAQSYKKNANKW